MRRTESHESLPAYLSEQGDFFEAVTNTIFEDLYAVTKPRWARLETIWRGRGGIRSNVVVEDQEDGYNGPTTPFYERWTILNVEHWTLNIEFWMLVFERQKNTLNLAWGIPWKLRSR